MLHIWYALTSSWTCFKLPSRPPTHTHTTTTSMILTNIMQDMKNNVDLNAEKVQDPNEKTNSSAGEPQSLQHMGKTQYTHKPHTHKRTQSLDCPAPLLLHTLMYPQDTENR